MLLTRIDNSQAVYQVCGSVLVHLSTPQVARAIGKLAGWSRWQDHVGNLTSKEVQDAGFLVLGPHG